MCISLEGVAGATAAAELCPSGASDPGAERVDRLTTAHRVLVASIDSTMAQLLKLNLERRGVDVQLQPWAACCNRGAMPQKCVADLVIADLDCPVPACWSAGPRLRATFAHTPLLILAHERPSARYLLQCEPCRSLQKPFAISEAVREIRALFASGY
jgi:DNA-binding response OmpR family regulator